MKRRTAIVFSGLIWLGIGGMLLYKGLRFISEGIGDPNALSRHFPPAALIAVGLLIGLIKGRFVFPKTVRRVVARICSQPEPLRLQTLYPAPYWILIGCMIGLGIIMRLLPIPVDARGLIDVAIGSALIHGAMLYFRAARTTYDMPIPSQSGQPDTAAPREGGE